MSTLKEESVIDSDIINKCTSYRNIFGYDMVFRT